jgi:non-heme chloroperoxidase
MALVETDDGIRLACRSEGTEGHPPVLLIPDWLSSSRLFDEMVPMLLEEDVRVLLYDPRGTGRSDRPETGYTLARQAEDARAVLERMTPAGVLVAGQGYGALVAMALAAQSPELVRGLVLLAPVPATGLRWQPVQVELWRGAVEDWRRLADLVASTSAQQLAPWRLTQVARDMAHTTRSAGLGQLALMDAPDLDGTIGRINCPVHVVAGEYDEWVSQERIRKGLLARLAGGRLAVLAGIGHSLALEAPLAAVNHLVEAVRYPMGRAVITLDDQNPEEIVAPEADGPAPIALTSLEGSEDARDEDRAIASVVDRWPPEPPATPVDATAPAPADTSPIAGEHAAGEDGQPKPD